MKHACNKHIMENLYIILTVIGLILWLIEPDSVHFLGASSVAYVLLLVLTSDYRLLALGLCIYLIAFFIMFIISVYKLSKGKLKLLYSLVCIDLIVSSSLIVYKVCTQNLNSLLIASAGLVIRWAYCIWMFRVRYRLHKQQ